MVYKVFDEPGEYIDSQGNPKNLLEAKIAHTPEGINVGWTEFENLQEAEQHFQLTKIVTDMEV